MIQIIRINMKSLYLTLLIFFILNYLYNHISLFLLSIIIGIVSINDNDVFAQSANHKVLAGGGNATHRLDDVYA